LRTSAARAPGAGVARGRSVAVTGATPLVLDLTSVGTRAGFLHATCGASGVIDRRTSRATALKAQEWSREARSDVQAFLAVRDSPYPRAFVVVSAESPEWMLDPETDESVGWLTTVALELGMVVLAPPLLDAEPPVGPNWSVTYSPDAQHLRVRVEEQLLYDGRADPLPQWSDVAGVEGQCLVLCSQVGMKSDILGGRTPATLDAFAHRGYVAGVIAAASSEVQENLALVE